MQHEAQSSDLLSMELDDTLLKSYWLALRRQWFAESERLDSYRVVWSPRAQTRTLGSCNVKLVKVTVAKELNYPQHRVWLKPLLYHEMCHAYLGCQYNAKRKRHSWHGREFKMLERRHPLTAIFQAWIKRGGWELAVKHDRQRRR